MSIQPKHIVISNQNQLTGIYTSKKIKELRLAITKYQLGNIYLGKIESILPNIEAAFVKLNPYEKNGFIHLNQLETITGKIKKKNCYLFYKQALNKKLLVQIVKEPTSNKGPSLSTNIGIIGNYLILLPFGSGINMSKKIIDSKEKHYVKGALTLLKPMSMGILVKKKATTATIVELKKDVIEIEQKWGILRTKLRKPSYVSLISSKRDFIKKTICGLHDSNVKKISTDSLYSAWTVYSTMMLLKQKFSYSPIIIEYHKNYISLAKHFCLDFSMHCMMQPRINLGIGGYIIIEKTEALTAVDINSGSFNHTINPRATILWLNCEAATEIAKQLTLRNIGGIIVIDFIDMSFQKDQIILLNHLNNVLKKDSSNARIIQLSEIGLVELTRRRQGQNIYDICGRRCAKCDGIGYTNSLSLISTNYFRVESFSMYSTYQKRTSF